MSFGRGIGSVSEIPAQSKEGVHDIAAGFYFDALVVKEVTGMG